MFGDGPLTFQEFASREPHPLAMIQDAMLEFLHGRNDAVLCGAQAVNAYVAESRLTQDVDIISPRAPELAEEVRVFLHNRFRIPVAVRKVKDGIGYRIYQTRKPQNRLLVDIRSVAALPPTQWVKKVHVVTPPELVANKVVSIVRRWGTPKGFQDQVDLYRLLLTFPALKQEEGLVSERLNAAKAGGDVMAAWKDLVMRDIQPEDEDAKFERW